MAYLTSDEVVARAPTLTPEQAQILRGLLSPVRSGQAESATESETTRRAS